MPGTKNESGPKNEKLMLLTQANTANVQQLGDN